MNTFTVPQELRGFAYREQGWFYALMFRAMSLSLMEFAQDGKHLGGTLGFSAVLHTWTREMGYHPHLHLIMPGLALSADGLRVRRAKGKWYMFPVKTLAAGFRNRVRRLIEARDAEEGTQHFMQIGRQVWRKPWVVDVRAVGRGQRAGELRTQLRLDVDALLGQAEVSDREDTDPQALPAETARREKLLGKMDAACAQLEARAQARAAVEQAEYERKVAARAERDGFAKGPEPKPPRDAPEPDEQINLSDPDARLMRKSKRESYTQSYNAQAIVDAEGSLLIVGQRVSTCAADVGETEADLAAIPPSLGTPTAALADCGYADKATIERLGRDRPGLDLYISVHREDAHAERRYDWRPLDKIKAPRVPTDPILIAMAKKLRTPEGKARYRRRACTVEPVFGIIKSAIGFR